jgi:hypothetical protein
MADPIPPDFTQHIHRLGGELRTHALTIQRKAAEEGQAHFMALIAEELDHCTQQYQTRLPPVVDSMRQQLVQAGQHRELYAATAGQIGFRRLDGVFDLRPVRQVPVSLARDGQANHFLASTPGGGLRFHLDGRLDSIEQPFSIPANQTRDQFSVTNLLPEAIGSLVWSGNRLLHDHRNPDDVVATGNFDTRRHVARQALAYEQRLLAFAFGKELNVLDLSRFMRRSSPARRQNTLVFNQTAAAGIGGVALWEGDGGIFVFATEPSRKRIMVHQQPAAYGLYLSMHPNDSVPLDNPLLRGDNFTFEFWYRLPALPASQMEIPLIGGAGYPSLYLDSQTRELIFRWEFPETPSLQKLERRSGALPINPAEWVHIAVTSQGNMIRVWLNARPVINLGHTNATPLPTSPFSHMALGNFSSTTHTSGMVGAIAELRTWDTALSQPHIRDRMRKWIVATEEGLPDDLVLYQRWGGMGVFAPYTLPNHTYQPTLRTGCDLARPNERFDISRPLGQGASDQGPLAAQQVYWEASRPISEWVTVDSKAGVAMWAEYGADGQWYLMQAPVSGHLPPQQVDAIPALTAALAHSPQMLAGDILGWALASEAAALRYGHQLQVRALHTAAAKVQWAYHRLLNVLATAERHQAQDHTQALHAEARLDWIARRNTQQRSSLSQQAEVHMQTSSALRQALNDVQQAEAEAVEIRKAAILRRLRGPR